MKLKKVESWTQQHDGTHKPINGYAASDGTNIFIAHRDAGWMITWHSATNENHLYNGYGILVRSRDTLKECRQIIALVLEHSIQGAFPDLYMQRPYPKGGEEFLFDIFKPISRGVKLA